MPLTQAEAMMVLNAILQRETKCLQVMLTPYTNELAHLRMRESPQGVIAPDGQRYYFVDPSLKSLSEPYQAPAWLEELCELDTELWSLLGGYRKRNA